MKQLDKEQQNKTYRGTVEEVFSHRSEIPTGAIVELKIVENASSHGEETPTMALMRAWLEEDATNDPAELEAAQQELDEFKRALNKPRKEAGARLLYPEEECI